jgi:phage gp46-like protein
MIALALDNNSQSGALVWGPGGLGTDEGLGTCMLISLFTDRRVAAEELAADAGGDLRGWVGDALAEVEDDRIGSRLWLLKREKQTEDTRQRAAEYATEALGWMEDDGLITGLEVDAEWIAREVLGLRVSWIGAGVARASVIPLRVGLT